MIAVCGASGRLGTIATRKLDIYKGSHFQHPVRSSTVVNFLDPAEIHTFLTGCSKCVWLVGTDKTDWYSKFLIECVMPVNVYKVCEILKIPFVWLSSVEVFDGLEPPYYPDSAKNPITVLGKIKSAAETFLTNAITIRVPRILEPLEGPQDAISRANYVEANTLIEMMLSLDEPGVYHISGPSFTAYEIGMAYEWEVTRVEKANKPLDLTTEGNLTIALTPRKKET